MENKILEFFLNNIGTEKVWIGVLALAVFAVFQLKPLPVIMYFSDKKRKEQEFILDLLKASTLSEEGIKFAREHLEKIAFLMAFGIRADADMRNALLKFHKLHLRQIRWHDLRRAFPNIKLVNGKITPTLGLLDHVLRWIVTGTALMIGAVALILFLYGFFGIPINSNALFAILISESVGLFVASLVIASLNWSYHSTRKIISICSSSD